MRKILVSLLIALLVAIPLIAVAYFNSNMNMGLDFSMQTRPAVTAATGDTRITRNDDTRFDRADNTRVIR